MGGNEQARAGDAGRGGEVRRQRGGADECSRCSHAGHGGADGEENVSDIAEVFLLSSKHNEARVGCRLWRVSKGWYSPSGLGDNSSMGYYQSKFTCGYLRNTRRLAYTSP